MFYIFNPKALQLIVFFVRFLPFRLVAQAWVLQGILAAQWATMNQGLWFKYLRRVMNYINDCFRTCYHFKVQVTLLPLPHQMTYHKAKLKSTIDESTILYLYDFFPINLLLFLGDSCLDHSPP